MGTCEINTKFDLKLQYNKYSNFKINIVRVENDFQKKQNLKVK